MNIFSRVYFYGGAFNPFTLAHQQIIDNIVKDMDDDDKLIIGVTTHDYKEYQYHHDKRYECVYRYMMNKYGMSICWQVLFQIDRTWNFLNKFIPEQDQDYITLIMGEDEYQDLQAGKWHHHEDILNTYKIKIIPRTNDISSTKVRALLNQNADFNELKQYISKEVYERIK